VSWMRFWLLGDLGQQLDLHDAQDRLSRLGASLAAERGVDRRQDDRLDLLEREVLVLEAGFSAVVQLLRDKGIVAAEELESAIGRQVGAAEARLAERRKAEAAEAKERAAALAQRKSQRRKSL
jgi:hypothetical protein